MFVAGVSWTDSTTAGGSTGRGAESGTARIGIMLFDYVAENLVILRNDSELWIKIMSFCSPCIPLSSSTELAELDDEVSLSFTI